MTYLTKYLKTVINENDTVLDICCGECNPTREINAKVKVGVDLAKHKLEQVRDCCVPIYSDVRKIGELFLPKSFDIVLWLDGIEHLEAEDASNTLEVAEKLAKKRMVIFTPDEMVHEDLEDELMRHKSLWPTKFWQDRGYVTSNHRSGPVRMVLGVLQIY